MFRYFDYLFNRQNNFLNRKHDYLNRQAIQDIKLHNDNVVSSYSITYSDKNEKMFKTIFMNYTTGQHEMPQYLRKNYPSFEFDK
jgi:hypothetical protein